MPFWPLTLIKRLVINRKVRPDEEDQNFTDIENSVNELHSFFNVALNPDGTIKNNAVSTAALQDRSVTVVQRAFDSNFYAVATGTGNALAIAFPAAPASVYASGMVFYLKAIADNTGAATLAVDGLAATAIKQATSVGGLQPLVAGNFKSGGIYELIYDGTQFVLVNPTTPASAVTGLIAVPTLSVYAGGAITWTDADLSLTIPAGAKSVVLNFRGNWNSATDGEVDAQVRTGVLGNIYDLGECGGVDGSTNRCQAITPCSAARHIEYQVQSSVLGAGLVEIDLVGFFL